MEKVGAKMEDMLENTLTPPESSNLFIAGSWKRQIGHQREKRMIFLYAKKEN